jgi:hypothetical protein
LSKNLSRWRSWTALFAAYALAIQTLFLALTLGAHAAQTSTDLHVLCLPSGQAPDNAPAPADTAHRIDCCVLGGNLLGKLLVPPQIHSVAAPQAKPATPAAAATATLVLPRPHSPLTARGPPPA